MNPVILKTRKSKEDYVAIERYISENSPQNAEIVINLFDQKLNLLATNNLIGRPRPELSPNLRSWNVHRFVIFYKPTEEGIILIRILHGSVDMNIRLFS